jgi:hypothetical protein
MIGEYARNEIAKEVVAFANTYGGTILVGIDETKDKPNRAKQPALLPQVHELARRLRQSIYDVIDPPLHVLEAAGIEAENEGTNGIVIVRTPVSRRRPHRLNANKEVYTRRAEETAVMDMRQVQELTIHSRAEARRIDDEIKESQNSFHNAVQAWLGLEQISESTNSSVTVGSVPRPGNAFSIIAVPTAPIDLGRVAGRSDVYPKFAPVNVTIEGNTFVEAWPFLPGDWRPTLRATLAETPYGEQKSRYELRTDGRCELSLFQRNESDASGFFIGWLIAAFAGMLFWIERIRRAGGLVGLEYALSIQFEIVGVPAVLGLYGAKRFSPIRQVLLPPGRVAFPLISVGSEDQFEQLLSRFEEDIWNCAGKHFSAGAPTYDLTQLRSSLR